MRVLVLGAGGPAGVNVCRALNAAGHQPIAVDANEAHLEWVAPYAEFAADALDADVVMAQPDPLVHKLAFDTELLPARFLPKPQTITLCQDKFECGLAWRREGIRTTPIKLIDSYEALTDAINTLGLPCWLRARHGAGAKGAICARNEMEPLAWFDFWRARDPEIDFVVEEFLPGRDYSWCGIYYEGQLLVSFARERIEYLYPHLTPEGLTGTPTIATVVDNADLELAARRAVLAVDAKSHGVFCVDLREDKEGFPRPTEINAGRFSTTVGLWSLYSERTNFVALAAELALGDQSRLETWEDLPEGLTLSRHIDCGHVFTEAKVAA